MRLENEDSKIFRPQTLLNKLYEKYFLKLFIRKINLEKVGNLGKNFVTPVQQNV